jgi:hypothetical protein
MSLGHRSASEAFRKGYRLRVGDEQGTGSHGRSEREKHRLRVRSRDSDRTLGTIKNCPAF